MVQRADGRARADDLPGQLRVPPVRHGHARNPTSTDVAAEIDRLLVDVRGAAQASRLPDEVDRAWIDDIVTRVHGAEVRTAVGPA